jgi:acyl-CoA thioester hydrolase
VFEKRVTVRWRDLDALGHVNNAVYLTYLEETLNDWLEPALGADWVTVRVEIDFRREVRGFGGEVTLRARVERVGTSSVATAVEILAPDGAVAAEAKTVVASFDPEARRARRLTGEQRERLARL